MNGDAGIGKSAIAQTVAERLAEEERLLASFFFSKDDTSRNSASRFVASIAYQLVQQIPLLMDYVVAVLDRDPLILNLSPAAQFSALITEPFLSFTASISFYSSPSVVIVDGLDKCEDHQDQILILNAIVSASQKNLPLSFFISTCPEEHLLEKFSSDSMETRCKILILNDFLVHNRPGEEIQIINSKEEYLYVHFATCLFHFTDEFQGGSRKSDRKMGYETCWTFWC